ncbi:hypothetical protein [Burkholderia pyrrocinia]|uniref:hypothetical protein n=1 Tax=Burkholderia pyrrocinia TaxID=60550 RepID=UPI001589524D|nr:hypothetical protein [Burkholderia pyrrocinia]
MNDAHASIHRAIALKEKGAAAMDARNGLGEKWRAVEYRELPKARQEARANRLNGLCAMVQARRFMRPSGVMSDDPL